jgi:hypothetical protein
MKLVGEVILFSDLEKEYNKSTPGSRHDPYFVFENGNHDNVYQYRGKSGLKFTYRGPSNRLFKTNTDARIIRVEGISF